MGKGRPQGQGADQQAHQQFRLAARPGGGYAQALRPILQSWE
jgi:hypothetical protein